MLYFDSRVFRLHCISTLYPSDQQRRFSIEYFLWFQDVSGYVIQLVFLFQFVYTLGGGARMSMALVEAE